MISCLQLEDLLSLFWPLVLFVPDKNHITCLILSCNLLSIFCLLTLFLSLALLTSFHNLSTPPSLLMFCVIHLHFPTLSAFYYSNILTCFMLFINSVARGMHNHHLSVNLFYHCIEPFHCLCESCAAFSILTWCFHM